jgi:S-adenosylmethionine decarboxylase
MSGAHLIIDAHNVPDRVDLDSRSAMQSLLIDVATKCHAHILRIVRHQFIPQGVSVLMLLAESHIAIHTSPETHSCHIDFYHCGEPAETARRMAYAAEMFKELVGGDQQSHILQRL